MIKKYYVVCLVDGMFEKGVFECEEIKEPTLKTSIDDIKNQIMTVNHRAKTADLIGIMSWQEL